MFCNKKCKHLESKVSSKATTKVGYARVVLIKWAMTWDFQQCGMCDQQNLRPACAYVQSDQSLCLSLEYYMSVKLLTEQHLELLTLKGGCYGSSESTLVKMPNCWKSRVTAQIWMITEFHHFHFSDHFRWRSRQCNIIYRRLHSDIKCHSKSWK